MGDRGPRGFDERSKPAEEVPPHSRLFIVCSKKYKDEDLREPFEKLGTVENIHIPRDRNSGDSKGVAYVKFAKTSAAAAAIKQYHMKPFGNESRPIKVMIACNRTENNGANNISEDKLNRLFIMVPKMAKEVDIREHFNQFGQVDSVFFQKNKATQENKGFAYVSFDSFYDAAKAYEECDPKYKPVFATPKDELKRGRNSMGTDFNGDSNNFNDNSNYGYAQDRQAGGSFGNIEASFGNNAGGFGNTGGGFGNNMGAYSNNVGAYGNNWSTRNRSDGNNVISVTVRPQLPSKYIETLFNIIPGMENFQYTNDNYLGASKAIITYRESGHATHAIERLNNFEFPSGEIVCVKPDKSPMIQAATDLKTIVDSFKTAVESGNGAGDLVQLAEAIAQATSYIKVATVGGTLETKSNDSPHCSVKLPLPQPLVVEPCVQRCFIVCKPKPPPLAALKDVFRRFGDLIDIVSYPNKTFLFAKYASVRAAQEAINTLHGATVCGATLKVMEADERRSNDDSKRMRMDMDDA